MRSHAIAALTAVFALLTAEALAQEPAQGPRDNQPSDTKDLAVSASGGPVIDPTKNVLDLVDAESKYQDAMREAEAKLSAANIEFGEKYAAERGRRMDDLREAYRDTNTLLRDTETKRVNDVLTVTAKALETANAVATETAKTLAAQVQSLATGLASQVDAAATATANNLARVEERIATAQTSLADRLALLEQYQNQGVGRQTVVDPQTVELNNSVNRLLAAQAAGVGKDEGQSMTIAFIFAGIGALVGLVGLVGIFLAHGANKKKDA